MCGIVGLWRPRGENADALDQCVRRMTASLRHRGPDAEGHWIAPMHGLALGYRRLAIVDLSPTGAQPMVSGSGRFRIVFNGEIYNYRALRAELAARGATFTGTSDTEVMLAAVEHWGVPRSLERFAGMFAFALWDGADAVLWLARDRMGEKPLYFGEFDGGLAFGSELKSLRQVVHFPTDIDAEAVGDVLRRGFIRGTRSIYRGIKKLEPGSWMRIGWSPKGFSIEHQQYWDVTRVLATPDAVGARLDVDGDRDAADGLEALLRQVVCDEMVADVPVGAFLSGGIDSSLVVALMQAVSGRPARTFTIAFDDDRFDESPFAREVAKHLGTDHTEVRLPGTQALSLIDRLPTIFDEPFADSSQLPTLMICEATRQHVTVALSGDGGDELFGGYSHYTGTDSIGRLVQRIPRLARVPIALGVSSMPARMLRMVVPGDTWAPNLRARLAITLRDDSPRTSHESRLSAWTDPRFVVTRALWPAVSRRTRDAVMWPRAASPEEERMAYDMQTYLPDDILVKVDRSAMAVSLESRAPLLDHRVVEFALRQPLHRKIREGRGKHLLREVLYRFVPRAIVDRPKRGFAVPLAAWLRRELRVWSEAMLEPDSTLREWFDPAAVQALWRRHQQGAEHSVRLWRLLMLMQWFRTSH